MMKLRTSEERGNADYGWLKTHHSFSFADYYDPKFMGFSVLRVINEDYIQGGEGFPTHGHRDMEIITYVVSGRLEHKDTLGTSSIIESGEIQKMTAGTGIRHSEYNPDPVVESHILQIWIVPDRNGHTPSYDQKSFSESLKTGELTLIASPNGAESSLKVHQNLKLYAARPTQAQAYNYPLSQNRKAWIQLVSGSLIINKLSLKPGDGLAIQEESLIEIKSQGPADFLLFDLP